MKHFAMSALLCLACACAHVQQERQMLLPREDMAYLTALTQAVLEASLVPEGSSVGGYGPNTTGGMLIRPGGRGAYPAFWIRDYAMSLDTGLVPAEAQRHLLFLTASHQVDAGRQLPSGSMLAPGNIPDHITFGGLPIYFPGTLEDFEGQGGPQWGMIPCLDNHFYFIHMAWVYAETTGDRGFLREAVGGTSMIARLEAAYAAVPADPETRLVSVGESNRGVNFGFYDTTIHTGDLLFASLLKWQSAQQLASLLRTLGEPGRARAYVQEAEVISRVLPPTFQLEDGFLRASTGLSAQRDVWGTAFAVYLGVLPEFTERRASRALADALTRGVITWEGGIRHVPTDADYSPDTAWERSLAARNRYQNGAYWDTPAGWVCYAVARVAPDAAARLAADYLRQLRQDDFRQGEHFGAPWECRHPEGAHRQNPVYLTSVSCPLAAFRRIEAEMRRSLLPGLRLGVSMEKEL